ncbi:hypothetical protein Pint_32684 [Pistacia integerrima]|uniref:Uncharacterized protein n=1 Tax=Pistacia integerrima TaxID=434235 RepID=A0ACC0XSZ2_9ROSI|nr:hypothetical protein Pint_32684 [Pistacia integerrima]
MFGIHSRIFLHSPLVFLKKPLPLSTPA